ncbi:hypothetical protein CJK33_21800 [Salmonella enterica subsp. enterica serovar Newport]|nr:hypothetical protein [Salmonella enterica subsp. enterica serovar Newport]
MRNKQSLDTVNGHVAQTFRKPARKIYINASKGSNPAFEYWVDKLLPGEKLPRGRYFKNCQFFKKFNTENRIILAESEIGMQINPDLLRQFKSISGDSGKTIIENCSTRIMFKPTN